MSYANMDGVPTQTAGASEILASDWNTYVRDNFDSIKFGHIVVANDAARPAGVGAGTMVFTTDTNTMWVYNGSAYVRAVGTNDLRDGAVTEAKISDDAVTAAKLADAVQNLLTPKGVINPYAGSTAPSGWLLCNGQAVSRSTYSDLFGVVGTLYGSGDNSTTFNVPDLRGRVAVGLGTNGDVDVLGDSDGISTVADRRPKHSHSVGAAGGHSHSVTDPGHAHAIGARPNSASGATYNAAVTTLNAGDNGNVVRGNTTGISIVGVGDHTHTVGPSGAPLDTVPYVVVNYIIKF